MKIPILTILLYFPQLLGSVDPTIIERCKRGLKERKSTQQMKEKILGLLDENARIYAKTPESRRTLRGKIIKTQNQLKQHLYVTTYRLSNEEENLIRQGCPLPEK
jgi:hypothetical protein